MTKQKGTIRFLNLQKKRSAFWFRPRRIKIWHKPPGYLKNKRSRRIPHKVTYEVKKRWQLHLLNNIGGLKKKFIGIRKKEWVYPYQMPKLKRLIKEKTLGFRVKASKVRRPSRLRNSICKLRSLFQKSHDIVSLVPKSPQTRQTESIPPRVCRRLIFKTRRRGVSVPVTLPALPRSGRAGEGERSAVWGVNPKQDLVPSLRGPSRRLREGDESSPPGGAGRRGSEGLRGPASSLLWREDAIPPRQRRGGLEASRKIQWKGRSLYGPILAQKTLSKYLQGRQLFKASMAIPLPPEVKDGKPFQNHVKFTAKSKPFQNHVKFTAKTTPTQAPAFPSEEGREPAEQCQPHRRRDKAIRLLIKKNYRMKSFLSKVFRRLTRWYTIKHFKKRQTRKYETFSMKLSLTRFLTNKILKGYYTAWSFKSLKNLWASRKNAKGGISRYIASNQAHLGATSGDRETRRVHGKMQSLLISLESRLDSNVLRLLNFKPAKAPKKDFVWRRKKIIHYCMARKTPTLPQGHDRHSASHGSKLLVKIQYTRKKKIKLWKEYLWKFKNSPLKKRLSSNYKLSNPLSTFSSLRVKQWINHGHVSARRYADIERSFFCKVPDQVEYSSQSGALNEGLGGSLRLTRRGDTQSESPRFQKLFHIPPALPFGRAGDISSLPRPGRREDRSDFVQNGDSPVRVGATPTNNLCTLPSGSWMLKLRKPQMYGNPGSIEGCRSQYWGNMMMNMGDRIDLGGYIKNLGFSLLPEEPLWHESETDSFYKVIPKEKMSTPLRQEIPRPPLSKGVSEFPGTNSRSSHEVGHPFEETVSYRSSFEPQHPPSLSPSRQSREGSRRDPQKAIGEMFGFSRYRFKSLSGSMNPWQSGEKLKDSTKKLQILKIKENLKNTLCLRKIIKPNSPSGKFYPSITGDLSGGELDDIPNKHILTPNSIKKLKLKRFTEAFFITYKNAHLIPRISVLFSNRNASQREGWKGSPNGKEVIIRYDVERDIKPIYENIGFNQSIYMLWPVVSLLKVKPWSSKLKNQLTKKTHNLLLKIQSESQRFPWDREKKEALKRSKRLWGKANQVFTRKRWHYPQPHQPEGPKGRESSCIIHQLISQRNRKGFLPWKSRHTANYGMMTLNTNWREYVKWQQQGRHFYSNKVYYKCDFMNIEFDFFHLVSQYYV